MSLYPNTAASFFGTLEQDGPSYKQTAGSTQLGNGSSLYADEGMLVAGGNLSTVSDSYGSSATIGVSEGTKLTVSGGDVVIDAGNSNHVYGTLQVDGNVSWTGGTYHPFVEGDLDSGPADLWWATGTFTIGGTAALAPAALDYEFTPIMPVSGYHWTILQADGYFNDTTQPSYNNAIWFLTPDDLPVQYWDLNAV